MNRSLRPPTWEASAGDAHGAGARGHVRDRYAGPFRSWWPREVEHRPQGHGAHGQDHGQHGRPPLPAPGHPGNGKAEHRARVGTGPSRTRSPTTCGFRSLPRIDHGTVHLRRFRLFEPRLGPLLMASAATTFAVAVCGLLAGGVFGALGCWAKVGGRQPLPALATAYTTVLRGIPELLVIYLFYFGGSAARPDRNVDGRRRFRRHPEPSQACWRSGSRRAPS